MTRHTTFFSPDPQDGSPQLLEDLATGYWYSEMLFASVELGIFTIIGENGKSLDELTGSLDMGLEELSRFLNALTTVGLIVKHGNKYCNTLLSNRYLVSGKQEYLGASILWRKELSQNWKTLASCLKSGGRTGFGEAVEDPVVRINRITRYTDAMACCAKVKTREMMSLFEGLDISGDMLDIGSGSGALASVFLNRFPLLTACLVDLPEVIEISKEIMQGEGLATRTSFVPANILGAWPLGGTQFDVIMLSNIVHAFSEAELPHLLAQATEHLKQEGLLIIHDFFLDHFPSKAALFDLNMFINTYNGRVFRSVVVEGELTKSGLSHTGLIPLNTDTAVIIGARQPDILSRLRQDPKQLLMSRILRLGVSDCRLISAEKIHVSEWPELKCRFGCDHYGSPHCPPHAPQAEHTRKAISGYCSALIIQGEPPTQDFQRMVLQAEREAFLIGFHRAFAYWAGPCSLCKICVDDKNCCNRKDARPSMEAAGIDVYETVRAAGLSLRTLADKTDFVKYFGLILLE